MRVTTKLTKDVLTFYKSNATIITTETGTSYMHLPLWVASTEKEGEFELISLDEQLPWDLKEFLDERRIGGKKNKKSSDKDKSSPYL
jgi:hypothetical protein